MCRRKKKITENCLAWRALKPVFRVFAALSLLSPIARAGNPILDAMSRLQSSYWDEVIHECRNEKGVGVLLRSRDSQGKVRYAVLTASHVSQGASLEGWAESGKKPPLAFMADPAGAVSPEGQSACRKAASKDTRLGRLADNQSDLEWIELEYPPEGARFFEFDPKKDAFCLSIAQEDSVAALEAGMRTLSTSGSTFAPVTRSTRKDPDAFTNGRDPHKEILARYSLQNGPRTEQGTTSDENFRFGGKSLDSLAVNGMSGSPNLHCEADSSGASTRSCCIDGIIRAFHRFFPRTYTGGGREIVGLQSSFLNEGKRGSLKPNYRWRYRDGETVLDFEIDGIQYQERNFELRNSGGGDIADGGDTDGEPAHARSETLPGIKRGVDSILGFLLRPSDGREARSIYANRTSVEDIELIARLMDAKIEVIHYPPRRGQLRELLQARLENARTEISSKLRRHLMRLRSAYSPTPQIPGSHPDWACFIDLPALQADSPEIRIKVLRGVHLGQASYLYLYVDPEGILKAVYDPELRSCQKINVEPAQALFPVRFSDRVFNREVQIDLRGLFFNDWFQSSDMWSRQLPFNMSHQELNPAELYGRIPYIIVQLGRDQRDWAIPCLPDRSGWFGEFPTDLSFEGCKTP